MVLEEFQGSLDRIEKKIDQMHAFLGIVPDLSIEISDIDQSIDNYKIYAKNVLNIEESTIKKHINVITNYLYFCSGQVTIETVDTYLHKNESQGWKNQQLKALRRYCRDFLNLGRWIESFPIKNVDKIKSKRHTSDLELAEFWHGLEGYVQLVFVLLHDTGLRLDECVQLKLQQINFELNTIDVSEFHKGETKFSWFVFFTDQTAELLLSYIKDNPDWFNTRDRRLLPISPRAVELQFQTVSNDLEMQITPKDLRSIWVRKMTDARIADRYIDAIQGRIGKKVISRHYTDYSPENLKKQYDKASKLFYLPLA